MFSDTNTGFTLLASLGAGQGQVLIPAVSLQDGEVKRKKEEEEGGGRKRLFTILSSPAAHSLVKPVELLFNPISNAADVTAATAP